VRTTVSPGHARPSEPKLSVLLRSSYAFSSLTVNRHLRLPDPAPAHLLCLIALLRAFEFKARQHATATVLVLLRVDAAVTFSLAHGVRPGGPAMVRRLLCRRNSVECGIVGDTQLTQQSSGLGQVQLSLRLRACMPTEFGMR
jgi:hypothetical protein